MSSVAWRRDSTVCPPTGGPWIFLCSHSLTSSSSLCLPLPIVFAALIFCLHPSSRLFHNPGARACRARTFSRSPARLFATESWRAWGTKGANSSAPAFPPTASPLRCTAYTALQGFESAFQGHPNMKAILLPDAQGTHNMLCNTGSRLADLDREIVD